MSDFCFGSTSKTFDGRFWFSGSRNSSRGTSWPRRPTSRSKPSAPSPSGPIRYAALQRHALIPSDSSDQLCLCLQRQRKLQKERLLNDFSAALNSFQKTQRQAADKEREFVARVRAGSRLSVRIPLCHLWDRCEGGVHLDGAHSGAAQLNVTGSRNRNIPASF